MSVIRILKESMYKEEDDDLVEALPVEEEPVDELPAEEPLDDPLDEPLEEPAEDKGDPQELVDGMLLNAPGQETQIGVILKYAANTNPAYDIWDASLDYFESIADQADANDEIIPDEEPLEDEPLADEPLPDEEPAEDEFAL